MHVRSSVLLLGLLLLLATSACRSAAPIEFDHAALHVHDLKKSAAFYGALGLKRIDDPFKDDAHVWMSMGRRQELHLIAGASAVASPRDMDVHLALRVASIAETVAILNRLNVTYYNSRQVPQAITTRPDGVKQLYVQDPDGYWLEINDAVR